MNRTILFSFLLMFFISANLKAQESAVTKKDVKNAVKELSDQRAKDALIYARTLYKPDARKELDNIIKGMDENELRLLYDYIEVVKKYGDKKEKQDKEKVQNTSVQERKYANMNFEKTSFDYGTIEQGEKVTHVYRFINDGAEPLKILTVKSTCGCAVPKWPTESIAPGKYGEIEVIFDSNSRMGVQSKRITIFANTDPQSTFLMLVGEVMKKRD